MPYPLPVIEIKSRSSSQPGVDWKASESKSRCCVLGGLTTLLLRGPLDTHHHTSIYLGSSTRCCWWKVAFWASVCWQHPPHNPSARAAGRRCASTPLGGRRLRSHVGVRGGCVGWESFSGARRLAGLPCKASLDVRRWRTTLIYSYSFFTSLTAVWPHPCWLVPQRQIQLYCSVLPPDPALTAMLLGLLSSYLSKQNKKTHNHNVHMVVGEEGRLGKQCPKCISAGSLCLIVLFCGLFGRVLFISRVHPHAHFLLSARLWPSTEWSSGIFGKICLIFFFLVYIILTRSLLQREVVHGAAQDNSFP